MKLSIYITNIFGIQASQTVFKVESLLYNIIGYLANHYNMGLIFLI